MDVHKEVGFWEEANKQLDLDLVEPTLRSGFRMLRFPAELETAFQTQEAVTRAGYRRAVTALLLVLYSGYGVLDWYLGAPALPALRLLHFGVICPALLLLILASFRPSGMLYFRAAFAGIALLAGLKSVAMTASVAVPMQYLFHMRLLFLAVVVFGLGLVSFWQACLVTAVVFGVQQAVLLTADLPAQILLNSEVLLATICLICALIGYQLEHGRRRSFLVNHLIETEKRRYENLAARDSLTGLANRRRFEEALQAEWNRATRASYPISLLLFDLDHFKAYNDTYGHQAGDDCLSRVAKTIKLYARRSGDLAARIGGEEFALITVNADLPAARRLAETIRQSVVLLSIPHRGAGSTSVVTISIGVSSTVPDVGDSVKQLITQADRALYEAKQAGRNRVAVSVPQLP